MGLPMMVFLGPSLAEGMGTQKEENVVLALPQNQHSASPGSFHATAEV